MSDFTSGAPSPAAATPSSTTAVSSGTASAALVKAAQASASADSTPGAQPGDTPKPGGPDTSAVKPLTTSPGETPATADSSAASPADSGPIDRVQHDSAVKAAKQEGIREGQRTYGWAKGLKQADVREAMDIRAQLNSDPLVYYQALTEMLTEKGLLKPGATPGKPAPTGQPFKLPRPGFRSDDGAEFYSAAQMQEIADGIFGEVDNRLKPLNADREQSQKAQAESQRVAAVKERAGELITEMKALPHYERFRKEMGDLLSEMTPERRMFLGGTPGALMWAYNQLVNTHVLPEAESLAEKRVRENLAKKANASRGAVSPTNASPAPGPPVLRNARDLARHMEQMSAQQSGS